MDEEIRTALGAEILKELDSLSSLEPGSREQQTAVENVTKLYRLGLDEIRADTDADEKYFRREMDEQQQKEQLAKQEREEELEQQKMKEQAKDRYIRLGMDAAGLILPMLFYGIWMRRGFKFEETGTFTSTTFRGLFNRFRPTNK